MWCRWSEKLDLAAVLRKKIFHRSLREFYIRYCNILFFTHKTVFPLDKMDKGHLHHLLDSSAGIYGSYKMDTVPYVPLASLGHDRYDSAKWQCQWAKVSCGWHSLWPRLGWLRHGAREVSVSQHGSVAVFRRCSVTENKEQFAKRTVMNPTSCHLHLSASIILHLSASICIYESTVGNSNDDVGLDFSEEIMAGFMPWKCSTPVQQVGSCLWQLASQIRNGCV